MNTTGAFSVKAGLTVKLILRSFDVAHSFYLPDFLFKIDVIPGHTNTYWFQSLQPGDYAIRCAEFCGLNHYTMTATLHVVKGAGSPRRRDDREPSAHRGPCARPGVARGPGGGSPGAYF